MAIKKTSAPEGVGGDGVGEEEPGDSRLSSGLSIRAPRGTQDILPGEQKYWEYVVEMAKTVARGWNFQRVDTPMFEDEQLFTVGVGLHTDLVSKEMFYLKARGVGRYVLRPEGSAAVARAYIERGLRAWPKPVKLFYLGPFFRYERPQAGRLRQHHQFGMEVFGSAAPVTDAQLIFIGRSLLQQLGLEEYTIAVNSLGEPGERRTYLKLLKEHYRRNRSKLCRLCKERLKTNPLRVLDCKEEKCQQVANTAPRLLDHLTEPSRRHFEAVLATLDGVDVPYEVTPALVRGLDYYTHTVFEFVSKAREGLAQSSVLSGGRYNNLVRDLGGKDTPAVGFGIGLERTIEQLKMEGVELSVADAPQVFVAHLGDEAKYRTLQLLRRLQEAGIPFAEAIDREGMQPQLKLADRLGVAWAVIIGHKEILDKTVILRSMDSGMQEVVPQDELVKELTRRLNFES